MQYSHYSNLYGDDRFGYIFFFLFLLPYGCLENEYFMLISGKQKKWENNEKVELNLLGFFFFLFSIMSEVKFVFNNKLIELPV